MADFLNELKSGKTTHVLRQKMQLRYSGMITSSVDFAKDPRTYKDCNISFRILEATGKEYLIRINVSYFAEIYIRKVGDAYIMYNIDDSPQSDNFTIVYFE